jgi:hypothetical protein
MNTRLRICAMLTLALAALSACGPDHTPPPPADPVTESQALMQPVTNANWVLSWSNGSLSGDRIILMPRSLGTSVPSYTEVVLADTTAGIMGSFTLNGYQYPAPGTTYQASVTALYFSPSPQLSYRDTSSPHPVADVEWTSGGNLAMSFQGDNLRFDDLTGEAPQDLGEFAFEADANLNTDIPLPVEQEPLPFDPTDDREDVRVCPSWIFIEDRTGFSQIPPQSTRSTRDTFEMFGDEIWSGWANGQYVIKGAFNADYSQASGRNDATEAYGFTIMLDSEPTENQSGSYPIQVLQITYNDTLRWQVLNPGTVNLNVTQWVHGAFKAELSATNFRWTDDWDSTNQIPPFLVKMEEQVEGNMQMYVPLPEYVQAYDNLCEHLEQGETRTLGVKEVISKYVLCAGVKYGCTKGCKASFRNKYGEDPPPITDFVQPGPELQELERCMLGCDAVYATCLIIYGSI